MFIFYEFRPFFVQITRALSIEKYGIYFLVYFSSVVKLFIYLSVLSHLLTLDVEGYYCT